MDFVVTCTSTMTGESPTSSTKISSYMYFIISVPTPIYIMAELPADITGINLDLSISSMIVVSMYFLHVVETAAKGGTFFVAPVDSHHKFLAFTDAIRLSAGRLLDSATIAIAANLVGKVVKSLNALSSVERGISRNRQFFHLID